jgi:catechol 2,3-dioxygenase-like lactoylglutathione lyase family enzyme
MAVDHVELFVPNRFEAADWYLHRLGLHVVEAYLEWASHPEGPLMVAPEGGGPMLALFTGKPQSSRGAAGLHRVAFRTSAAGFLAFLEQLIAYPVHTASGEVTAEPRIVDHGRALSAYFHDPYGTPLEVTTYEPEPVRARLGMTPEHAEL